MALSLTAYLNQRFQFSYDVTAYASLYSNLNLASWRCQIRPSAGSPVVALDFASGGSPQNAANTIVYYAADSLISLFCPTSSLLIVPPSTYVFDFGFTLPGDDFERVDGGTITFLTGSTSAGVQGSPAAPPGSDDTVSMGSGSIPNPVPATIIAALAAASSSANAAAAAAGLAAASATAAAASLATAQAATSTAINAQLGAETAAAAAVAAHGLRIATQTLTVTATNTLSGLTYPWTGYFSMLFVKNTTSYTTTGSSSAYEISGSAVLWHQANAGGLNLNPGDKVVIAYSY